MLGGSGHTSSEIFWSNVPKEFVVFVLQALDPVVPRGPMECRRLWNSCYGLGQGLLGDQTRTQGFVFFACALANFPFF